MIKIYRLMVYGFSLFACTLQAAVLSVEDGTVLSIDGAVSVNQVVINSNAVLSGAGTLTGNLLLKGALKPGGDGVGSFTIQSNLVSNGGEFDLQAVSNTVADAVDVLGAVSGTGRVFLSAFGGVSPQGLAVILGGTGSHYSELSVSPGSPNWMIRQSGNNLLIHELAYDDDGDGLTDYIETISGTDPRNADTDGDSFDDYFEVMNGGYPTNSQAAYVDYIRSNGGTFDLYSSNVVLDVAVGQVALEISGGNAELTLQLMQSDDLVIWANAAPPVNWSLPVDAEKQFFRIRAEP